MYEIILIYRDSSDDDDGGSGTDDEEQQKKKDSIPEWARGQKLKDALDLQYGKII